MRIFIIFLTIVLSTSTAIGQSITLVTLGDSLTFGDGDETAQGGFPARLINRLLVSHPGSTLNNFAQSGNTSQDLINMQLQPAVDILNSAPAGSIKMAIIWIGSNDLFGLYNYVCDVDYDNDYSRCEPYDLNVYTNNITTILNSLSATGAKIYLALLDDQSRRPVMTDPARRSAGYDRISETDLPRMSNQVRLYNDTLLYAATTRGLGVANFFTTTIFENWNTLSDDGNHPNAAGYDAITDIWYQVVTAP
ncbi:MAG: SGNH/GDSL hydrolase family protein [Thermodesulfobacteriota bacterium]